MGRMIPTTKEIQLAIAEVLEQHGPMAQGPAIKYVSAHIRSTADESGNPPRIVPTDFDSKIEAELGYMYDKRILEKRSDTYNDQWYRLTEKGRILFFGSAIEKMSEIWSTHWLAILGIGVAILGNIITLVALVVQVLKK